MKLSSGKPYKSLKLGFVNAVVIFSINTFSKHSVSAYSDRILYTIKFVLQSDVT